MENANVVWLQFVEQFPCPICQRSGYDATEFGVGLATTVFYMQGMWCYHGLEKDLWWK